MSLKSILLLAGALALASAAAAHDAVPLRLIGINDLHGNLEAAPNLNLFMLDPGQADGPLMRVNVGGAAALGGVVRQLRAGSRHSFMIGAGDLIGGAPLVSTLFRHETTIEILGDIGLEASALGNHEFDAGKEELLRLIRGGCAKNAPDNPVASCVTQSPYRGARFRYLGANVVDGRGRHIVAPYTIKRFGGIPVGFVGGVTKTTPQMVSASGIVGLRFLDEADAINSSVAALRRKGVKAFVATFHEGIELGTPESRGDWNDPACPLARGALLDIVRRLDRDIKVIFSGHTHQGYRCELENGRVLIQGTAFGRGVSVVDVELDRRTRTLKAVRSVNLPVFNERTDPRHRDKLAAATPEPFAAVLREARPDPAIAEKVARYTALVAPTAERSVGRISGPFTRSGRSDWSAGRLIADAQLAATRSEGAQVAFMNPGGIRSNLDCAAPPCTITFGQAFTMQPFGNSLVVMDLTGDQLKALLESQQPRLSGEPRFLQPSEGFTYTWQNDAPPGERVRDMRLHGEPLDPAKTYRVTVNSFLADGGDAFEVLKAGQNRKGGGLDLDALVAYLGSGERGPSDTPRVTRLP